MKKIFILSTAFLVTHIADAQSVNVATGKKMAVVTEQKMNMSMSAMGQDVNLDLSSTITSDYDVIAVTNKGYSLRTKTTRMQNTNKTMGMEKSFDSNNETDRNDPMWAEVMKQLNKPTEIVIEDHTASVASGEIMNSLAQFGLKENSPDLMKFILYKSDLDLMKPGYRWTDSIHTTDYNIVNESVVTSLSPTQIELSVKTMLLINTNVQQNGMEAKVSFHGDINSRRYYDRSTGVMISETADTKMDGETEVMEQKIPMKITGKTNVTVK